MSTSRPEIKVYKPEPITTMAFYGMYNNLDVVLAVGRHVPEEIHRFKLTHTQLHYHPLQDIQGAPGRVIREGWGDILAQWI